MRQRFCTVLAFVLVATTACNLDDPGEGVVPTNNATTGNNMVVNNATTNNATTNNATTNNATTNNATTGNNATYLEVVATQPADGATLQADLQPLIEFSEDLDASTVTPAAFSLVSNEGSALGFSVELVGTSSVAFTPANALEPGGYTITAQTSLAGQSGATLEQAFDFSFVVPDPDTFDFVAITPMQDARDVGVRAVVQISFTSEVDPQAFDPAVIRVSSPDPHPGISDDAIPVNVEVDQNLLKITPQSGRWQEYMTTYRLEVVGPITGANGVATTAEPSLTFTTVMFQRGAAYEVYSEAYEDNRGVEVVNGQLELSRSSLGGPDAWYFMPLSTPVNGTVGHYFMSPENPPQRVVEFGLSANDPIGVTPFDATAPPMVGEFFLPRRAMTPQGPGIIGPGASAYYFVFEVRVGTELFFLRQSGDELELGRDANKNENWWWFQRLNP